MKKIYCFVAFFIVYANVFAQELSIAQVNSDAACRDFVVQQNYDKDNAPQWNHFYLSDGTEWQSYYNLNQQQQEFLNQYLITKSWAKADLNHDGKPDLIVSGYIARRPKDWNTATFKLLVFLSDNGNAVNEMNLTDDQLDKYPAYFNIISDDGKPYLELFRWKNFSSPHGKIPLQTDTLQYNAMLQYFVQKTDYFNPDDIARVDYLVEENKAGAYHSLAIANQDGKSYPLAITLMQQGFKTPSHYTAKMTKTLWSNIDTLIRSFQFSGDSIVYNNDIYTLKEKLPISLSITFKDGTVKKIRDYDADASYTLMTLYQVFEDIINNTLDLYNQRQQQTFDDWSDW